ncbi:MAG TPA: TRAFs-binding domain-containing protein [Stellaceae bacterium]|nr:TRAFs-binding domain-containing protein [Stellaceae bacterium]
MNKPLCFVLMPFGLKADENGRTIDFDAVYREIIAKAIEFADMEPIRADEEQVGGTIHKPMFERLLLCDFAVADLTGANPNVYYELGIRHAIKPRTTALVVCEGVRRPFDVAPLRTWTYQVDGDGKPLDADIKAHEIGELLRSVAHHGGNDSPVFELVDFVELPRMSAVAREKTDIFRKHVADTKALKAELDDAVHAGREAVHEFAARPMFRDLHLAETGMVINLYLAFRAVEDFAAMVELYKRMPEPLQRMVMVREQYAFALNRLKRRDEAERELKELIQLYGATSENCGLLGRIYKDRWQEAVEKKDLRRARGFLKQALETYLTGFETDWRDTYPGINALTLFESLDAPDPRRDELLPVVRYAAQRRARAPAADYWDHATLLEIAVLAGNQDEAFDATDRALAAAHESFAPRSTANNLRIIREKRAAAGADVEWIKGIEDDLVKCADALAEGEKAQAG